MTQFSSYYFEVTNRKTFYKNEYLIQMKHLMQRSKICNSLEDLLFGIMEKEVEQQSSRVIINIEVGHNGRREVEDILNILSRNYARNNLAFLNTYPKRFKIKIL